MKGRKRLPTKTKELKGTLQPCRANKKEPKVAIMKPDCPEWLPEEAREFYHEISDMLKDMNIIGKADKTMLSLFANTYMEWRQANDFLKERKATSYTTISTAGDKIYKAYPEVAMRSDAARRLQSLASEFGLSPASRSKVSTLDQEDEDPMAKLLGNS